MTRKIFNKPVADKKSTKKAKEKESENKDFQEQINADDETPEEQKNLEEHRQFRKGMSENIPESEPLPEEAEMDPMSVPVIERDKKQNNTQHQPAEQTAEKNNENIDEEELPPITDDEQQQQPSNEEELEPNPNIPQQPAEEEQPIEPETLDDQLSNKQRAERTFDFYFQSSNALIYRFGSKIIEIKPKKEFELFPGISKAIEQHNEQNKQKLLFTKDDYNLLKGPAVQVLMKKRPTTPEQELIGAVAIILSDKAINTLPAIRKENAILMQQIKMELAQYYQQHGSPEIKPTEPEPKHQENKDEKEEKTNKK